MKRFVYLLSRLRFSVVGSLLVKRIILVLLITSLTVCGVAIALEITTIRTIRVVGMPVELRFDRNKIALNYFFFPVEKVTRLLLSDYPQFQTVTITKQFPSTIVIHIEPRLAIAKLQTANRSVLVASDGIVIADAVNQQLPTVEALSVSVRLGSQVTDTRVLKSLAFLAKMNQDETIDTIEVVDTVRYMRVTTPLYTVWLSEKKAGEQSALELQSVVTGFRIKGQIPKQIDLRFDQPVVTW